MDSEIAHEDLNGIEEMVECDAQNKKTILPVNWVSVNNQISKYRLKIPEKKRMYNPLYYFIIDHTGQHIPTMKLLRSTITNIKNIWIPLSCVDEGNFFDAVIKRLQMDDLDLLPAGTLELRRIKDLLRQLGEKSIVACASRRNERRDPQLAALPGHKCDFLVTCKSASWTPEIGVGEVSGRLPQCNRAKYWEDKINLSLELRDILIRIKKHLHGVNTAKLRVYGWQLTGLRLKIYSLSCEGELLHLRLEREAWLPSDESNLYTAEDGINAFRAFGQMMAKTAQHLHQLCKEKIL
ncbi:7173_t:CDS:2, partial [Paraglomus occultum]